MHALFNHAIRYEWIPQNANPLSKVRQSAKRERIPDVLEVSEFKALVEELSLRERTLVALDGIRVRALSHPSTATVRTIRVRSTRAQ